jgi:hypothetical protein
MRPWRIAWMTALLLPALPGLPAAAETLSLAWGAVAEPAQPGTLTPGQVAEHLEFLQAHGWQAVRGSSLLGAADPGGRPVLLSFDDPASALRYAVPLLELYRMPAAVTVSRVQAADPALAPVLQGLAASPWVELLPRVEPEPEEEPAPAVRCTAGATDSVDAARRQEKRLSRLSQTLAAQVARLREVTGVTPAGVAWSPGTWSGPAEAVAANLGLTLQMPTFTAMPPSLDLPRVARYRVPPWAGIWALVQADAHWDPRDHPVRFVEVDAAWICAGGDPQARVARVVAVVRRLGLNGVRLLPGGPAGAWFETAAAPLRGDVAGPLARALRAAGVRWVIADLPASSGDPGRDVTFAADLARAVDLDVAVVPPISPAVLPAVSPGLGEAVRAVRPAVRLAWREEEHAGGHAFDLAPLAPGRPSAHGITVSSAAVASANAEAAGRAVAGWEWIGLPVELAETGLETSLRSLAAFALPREFP